MISPLIISPDVDRYLVGYLREQLAAHGWDDVVVSISAPDPLPLRLIVVRRDGGPRLDQVRELARYGIQVWAENDEDVNALSALVGALIIASPDGNPVLSARLSSGSSSVSEPNPNRRRRYCTFELTVRCSVPVQP